MGCQLSKSYLTLADTVLDKQLSNIAFLSDPKETFRFLRNKFDQDFECIFVLGGAGSNKGEFIYDLLKDTSSDVDGDDQPKKYIDIEELILRNIKERIGALSLTTDQVNNEEEEVTQDTNCDNRDNFLSNLKLLKEKIDILLTLITNHWILQLIEKELESNASQAQLKFIINLIPNQINLFQNCLYLKNGPNFSSFNHTFIAINLIRNDQSKKDLDLVLDYHVYDKINQTFVNYFRNLDRLIDLKVTRRKKAKPKIKISRSLKAIKVKSVHHLEDLIRSSENASLELNISEFKYPLQRVTKGPITFLVNGYINIGDEVISVDSSETDLKAVHNFAHIYTQLLKSIRLEHRKGLVCIKSSGHVERLGATNLVSALTSKVKTINDHWQTHTSCSIPNQKSAYTINVTLSFTTCTLLASSSGHTLSSRSVCTLILLPHWPDKVKQSLVDCNKIDLSAFNKTLRYKFDAKLV